MKQSKPKLPPITIRWTPALVTALDIILRGLRIADRSHIDNAITPHLLHLAGRREKELRERTVLDIKRALERAQGLTLDCDVLDAMAALEDKVTRRNGETPNINAEGQP